MVERVAQWLVHGREELRLLAPYAAAALVTGGSVSSALVVLVWLFQHHHAAEPRT